jgi:hypothetical protein
MTMRCSSWTLPTWIGLKSLLLGEIVVAAFVTVILDVNAGQVLRNEEKAKAMLEVQVV